MKIWKNKIDMAVSGQLLKFDKYVINDGSGIFPFDATQRYPINLLQLFKA